MTMVKVRKILLNIFRGAFLWMFLWAFLNALFFTHPGRIVIDRGKSLLWMLLWAAIGFGLYFLLQKIKTSQGAVCLKIKSQENLLVFAALFLFFVLQAVVLFYVYQQTGWDAGMVYGSAYSLITSPENYQLPDYFYQYPNNVFLLVLERYFLKLPIGVWGWQDLSLCYYLLLLVNLVITDIVIGICFFLIRDRFGSLWGWLEIALGCLLFGLSPWLTVFYSDILSIFVAPVFLLLFFQLKRDGHALSSGLILFIAGFLMAVGLKIKPQTIIVCIAIVLWEGFKSISSVEKTRWKRLLFSFFKRSCVFGVGFLCCISLISAVETRVLSPYGWTTDGDAEVEFPWTHFLMMGATATENAEGTVYYGGYNHECVQYTSSITGYKAKQTANLQVFKNTLREYGVWNYLDFLNHKFNWVMNDGTFFWAGEGEFYQGVSEQVEEIRGPIGEKAQQLLQVSSDRNTSGFSFLAEMQQGLWLVVLFFITLPLFLKWRDQEDDFVGILRITITGLILFLLLFEARSRYLILYLPVFSMLAIAGGYSLEQTCKNKMKI